MKSLLRDRAPIAPTPAGLVAALALLLSAGCAGPGGDVGHADGGPAAVSPPVARTAAARAPQAAPAGGSGSPRAVETESTGEASERPTPAPSISRERIPAGLRSCHGCHADVVRTFLDEHGMAVSVGTVEGAPTGTVANPRSGRRYEVGDGAGGPWLTTIEPDGGRRRQRVVGRIGAGRFATSWVTAEADVVTRVASGRLFFAPVETVVEHGLVLAPFEHHDGSPGPDMALTEGCLTCHVTAALEDLPGAATGGRDAIFPSNHLGANAFEHLPAIGCEACHGDATYHVELMASPEPAIGSGLLSLGALPAATQRDVCARCHLQGDSRWALVDGAPSTGSPLPAQVPVLVPATSLTDFRFVAQHERLALSACFTSSPAMTCSTCHEPHRGVAAQGIADFEARCMECHRREACARPRDLTVSEVSGESARGPDGCVDCHVRRSQPFDLTEVRSADHWIRRRIEPPVSGSPHRQFADPAGPVRLFDRERLAAHLDTPGGRVWETAVLAVGLTTMGRFEEAAARFDELPAAGSPAAIAPVAPPPLRPVLDHPDLHHTRALTLLSRGRVEEARAAFGDALRLDPEHPGARLGRARLRFGGSDVAGMLEDTQVVIDAFPRAEQPWRLRLELAERAGRMDLAEQALEEITGRWPSDAAAWQKLGLLLEQRGDPRAAEALRRATLLSPSLDLRRQSR